MYQYVCMCVLRKIDIYRQIERQRQTERWRNKIDSEKEIHKHSYKVLNSLSDKN